MFLKILEIEFVVLYCVFGRYAVEVISYLTAVKKNVKSL